MNDKNRDMFYSNYGYQGMNPGAMPFSNPEMFPNQNMIPNPNMMPNQGMMSNQYQSNNLETRVNNLEKQINRLNTRVSRLENPYGNNNTSINNEPDSSMYMI